MFDLAPAPRFPGEIHSNKGVRFDGLAYNLIASALSSYDDPDHSGGNEFGVHTHVSPVDPSPPASVPTRTDVFTVGRQFPVPEVDFVGIIQTLSQIKESASSSGFYRGPSGSYGYEVVLKTDDTFDIFRVTALATPAQLVVRILLIRTAGVPWSVGSETLLGNYPIPANGLIFWKDDSWVKGHH